VRHVLEDFAREVQRGAHARMSERQRARRCARQCNEFRDIFRRHVVVDHEYVGIRIHLRDRSQILHRVIRQFLVEAAVDNDVGAGQHADCIAIGSRFRHAIRGDVAACAGHVLDDDRLSERLAEPVGQKPGHDVDPGRKSEQQPNIRIIRLCAGGKSREQKERCHAGETQRAHDDAPVAAGNRREGTAIGRFSVEAICSTMRRRFQSTAFPADKKEPAHNKI
jgi:hypothetical protein